MQGYYTSSSEKSKESKLQEVLALLPLLTADERAKVITHINLLAAVKGEPSPIDPDEQLVLGEIVGLGIDTRTVDLLRQQRRGYATFQANLPGLLKYLRSATTDADEQRLLLRCGLQMVHKDLREWMKQPINAVTMMNNIHSIPAVLNKSYPGYARTLLPSLLRRGLVR